MSDTKPTATSLRYEANFADCLSRYANLSTVSGKGTFPIPGLANTLVEGSDCSCMTPQGITVAKDYIIISAYCNQEKYKSDLTKHADAGDNKKALASEASHKQHHTVLYILNKKTKALISTLALEDYTHAGGITFDGTYLWVCQDVSKKISCIAFKDIEAAVAKKADHIKYERTVEIGCNSIFCIYYGGLLWVGDCGSKTGGSLKGFKVNVVLGIETLKLEREIEIPALTNGGLLVDFDGKTHFAFTTSGGRDNPSMVHLYTVDLKNGGKFIHLKDKAASFIGELVLPPMGEEICIDGNSADSLVYTLFESGSTPYSAVAGHPCKGIVDRVCIATARDWFPNLSHT